MGKKGAEGISNIKERAIILHLTTSESRKEFLKNRTMLKKIGIFLGDDLMVA